MWPNVLEGVLTVSVEAQTIALVIQVTHWTGVAIVWSSAPVDVWMVSVQVLQLISLLALWLSYIKFPLHLLWSGDTLCIYLTFHIHKSFYQFFFQTYKLTEKLIFSGAQMVNTRSRETMACLLFSSDMPATFVSLCSLTTNQQLCAHICIQMQVLFVVTRISVFFPVLTLEEVKALVTSHFCD